MPGARSTRSLARSVGRTNASLGDSRCVTRSPASSTTIHWRSHSRPVSMTSAWSTAMRAHDLTGCTYKPAIETVDSFMALAIVPWVPHGGHAAYNAPMHTVDVAIHGRGAVASSLALALNRQGLRVALSAPAPAAQRDDVRAYALNMASRRLLQQLRIWEALPTDAVTAVHDMDVRGDGGAQLGFSSWTQCVDALAWIVDAQALDAALQQALQFATHVQRADVLPPAALRVHAEGKDSASRAALPVQWDRRPYGHTAIAARLVSLDPH